MRVKIFMYQQDGIILRMVVKAWNLSQGVCQPVLLILSRQCWCSLLKDCFPSFLLQSSSIKAIFIISAKTNPHFLFLEVFYCFWEAGWEVAQVGSLLPSWRWPWTSFCSSYLYLLSVEVTGVDYSAGFWGLNLGLQVPCHLATEFQLHLRFYNWEHQPIVHVVWAPQLPERLTVTKVFHIHAFCPP